MISAIPFAVIDAYEGVDIGDTRENYSFFKIKDIPKVYIIVRLVRTFKIFKSNLPGEFSSFLEKYLSAPKVKSILFVFMVSICVHVVACIWYFASRVQGFTDKTWVSQIGIESDNTDTKYLCSVYWAITTLTTIGYGDITPKNDLERCICIAWMLIGAGFYSYTIGSLSSMISSIDAQQAVLVQRLYTISDFADESELDTETKLELRNAIIYSSTQNGMSWSEKIELFKEIPRNLKFKIASKIYKGAVNKLIFFQNKDPTFIVHVIPHLNPHHIPDNQFVYEEGNFADELYFVLSSRVVLTYKPKNLVYKSYLKGTYFGEIEVIEKISRIDTVKTFGECDMLTLASEVFLQILQDFPREAESIFKIASKRKVKDIESKQKIIDLTDGDTTMEEYVKTH